MSQPDFDPTLFDALVEGARRTACCDEAELRTHQLRNERHGRILRGTDDPRPVSWAWVVLLIVALGLAAFATGHMEPPNFNPFNR